MTTRRRTTTTTYKDSVCGPCGVSNSEYLEYDYSKSNNKQCIRVRERNEYYIDSFNDQPLSWTCGTNEYVRTQILSETK